jgi:tetratricopeptide (TPR) repeat protein
MMQICGNSILQILIKKHRIILCQPLISQKAIVWVRRKMKRIDGRDVPTEAEYLCRQAREKVDSREYQQAMDFLHRAVKIAPHHIHSLIEIGNCYEYLNQSDKAILYYEQVIQIDPFHAEAWFNKGMSMKKTGNEKEATLCIERAIELYCGR